MAQPLKVAIIGAGPAGLTLARLLHVSKATIDLTVYELDASSTSRPDQGGTLDLHTDTGLAAIRKCDLWDSFRRYARYEGSELIIRDRNATTLAHVRGGEKKGPFDRPEIDRHRLREIMLESVPETCLRWGWHLREVTEDGMLRFDGREQLEGPFDLVVGADGAWSKVRDRLSGQKPVYSGVSGYELEIREPAKTCPRVNAFVGRGGMFGLSDRQCLNAQRMGNDSLKVRTWFLRQEGDAKAYLDKHGQKETLNWMFEKYATWAPEMLELLHQADSKTLKQWTLYELPVGHFWEHRKGFTLVGDAVSLSTPFSGEGVNKAMKDSLELAEMMEKSLESDGTLTLDQAVLEYEKTMFRRSEELQIFTRDNKAAMFGSDVPYGLMTPMIKKLANDSSSRFVKISGTSPFINLVYFFFWLRAMIGLALRRFWRRT